MANTIELVLPSAHPSPQPKRQIDRFSSFAQLTAKSPYTLQWAPLSPKIAPSHGGSGTPSITWFLGLFWAHNPNGITIGSAVFAQMTAECPYNVQWDAPFLPQNSPVSWGIWTPHLIHGSLGQPESSTQTASQSVQPFLQGLLVWQTVWPIDQQTTLLGR